MPQYSEERKQVILAKMAPPNHRIVADLEVYLQAHSDQDDVRRAVVRNSYQPEHNVLTGVGSITLPKTRDRAGRGRRFLSALFPPYLKKTAATGIGAAVAVSQERIDQRLRRSAQGAVR